ncbi:MAG: hypothetical protein GH159_02160 [Dehalococcoidia bacterium]|nr:hypothetical protein [Dehalococcoidia bacterium]
MKQPQPFKNIPSECKMPDLSDLKPLLGIMIIQALFGDKLGLSHKTQLYLKNFIRLIDKALSAHKESRQCILDTIAERKRPTEEMAKEGRIIYMLAFPNHMETCINAVARSYKLLDRIKSDKQKEESPMFPRELKRLAKTQFESVTNIRNAVEHIDKLILKDEIAPGQPIMLALNRNHDGVMISDYEIKFEELAMVLRRMHEIAQYILKVKPQKS